MVAAFLPHREVVKRFGDFRRDPQVDRSHANCASKAWDCCVVCALKYDLDHSYCMSGGDCDATKKLDG